MSRISDDRPRAHPYRFAHLSLRRLAAQDPLRFAEASRRDGFNEFLVGLWGAVGESLPPKDRVSPEGMECRRYEHDADVVVVVRLPKPEHAAEAHFVAAVVAPGGDMRYFTLEHSWNLDESARTVLGEWVVDDHFNLGTGPRPDEGAFLAAVEHRLNSA